MTRRVRIRPAAESDIWAAVEWYETHAQGVRLLDEVSAAIVRITEMPGLHRAVHGQVRRVPLRVFPYFLWYLDDEEAGVVHVLALTHHRRDPDAVRSLLGTEQ